ncbi:MAG TPA: hypothetical protein VIX63_06130 [Vicinamibacterales bacterium]
MAKGTWQRFGDLLMSAAAVAIVVIVLVAADVRVRDQARSMATHASHSTVGSATAEVRNVSSVLYLSAKNRSLDHGPVVVFVAVAAILVLFMARS